ncbi:unnamed protein product [Adineta ricciae]|uniref:Protein kinase domain-containing protein n=1 Tax=Adineta ricciae TaxID=249248 RepID=A0A816H7P7_ADIRI|nr:unnamed protein product [Adineta ricciae]
MSAIKRFFSSHKTSSNVKNNQNQQQDSHVSQSKLPAINTTSAVPVDKVTVATEIVENDESKENMASPPFPSIDIPLKSDTTAISPTTSPTSEPVLASNHEEKRSIKSSSWTVEDFEIGNLLGRGRFGYVYCGREKQTRFVVALKILFKAQLKNSKMEQQVKREIEIQSNLKYVQVCCFSSLNY